MTDPTDTRTPDPLREALRDGLKPWEQGIADPKAVAKIIAGAALAAHPVPDTRPETASDLLREALHRPAVLHRPGCAEGDLLDRLTLDDSFMECSCGGTSQFHDAVEGGNP